MWLVQGLSGLCGHLVPRRVECATHSRGDSPLPSTHDLVFTGRIEAMAVSSSSELRGSELSGSELSGSSELSEHTFEMGRQLDPGRLTSTKGSEVKPCTPKSLARKPVAERILTLSSQLGGSGAGRTNGVLPKRRSLTPLRSSSAACTCSPPAISDGSTPTDAAEISTPSPTRHCCAVAAGDAADAREKRRRAAACNTSAASFSWPPALLAAARAELVAFGGRIGCTRSTGSEDGSSHPQGISAPCEYEAVGRGKK